MSSIPVHRSSPINPNAAAKASGTTPSTTAARFVPAGPATTTTAPAPSSASARPGAPAMPQPTGSLNNPNPAPTPTTTLPTSATTSNPPPPQPGVSPSLYASTTVQNTPGPAPPQPGGVPQAQTGVRPTTTQTPSYPPAPLPAHQQSPQLYTPVRAQPPASSTTTTFSPTFSPNSAFTPTDLSHPPGYRQNHRASFDDHVPADSYQTFDNLTNTTPQRGGGILDGNNSRLHGDDGDQGVWDTAVSWAKAAGQTLSKGEEKVWRTINGEK